MLNLIQRNPFATALVCTLLLLTLWIPAFLLSTTPDSLTPERMMPLQRWMMDDLHLQGSAGIWTSLLALSLSTCLLLLLNRRHLIVAGQEQFMLLLFILLSSATPDCQQFTGAQAAAFFVLLSVYYLFQSIQMLRATSALFLAAFFTSTAGMFYFPAAIVLFVLFIGILISKPFAWRDWIAYCSGMATPWCYLFFQHYLRYGSYTDCRDMIFANIPRPAMPELALSASEVALFVLLGVMAVCSFFPGRPSGSLIKVKSTRMRQVLKCMLFFLFPAALLFSASQPGMMPLLAIPLSILAANYYDNLRRRRLFNLLLFLICLAVASTRMS
jgi:hypothetical protein